MSTAKRMKVDHNERGEDMSSARNDMKHIQDLSNDVFRHCLEFVGNGNFAFVAPVSKHFYWNYINLGVEMKNNVIDVDVILQQGRNKKTTAKDVATGSLRLATECFLTASEEFQKEVCRQAAVNGRLDILKCADAFGIDMESVFPCKPDDGYDELRRTGKAIVETIANGHLDIIEYLHDQGIDLDELITHIPGDPYETMRQKKCKASSLHWMVAKGIFSAWKNNVIDYLVQNGELEILKEQYANSLHLKYTFEVCAEGGNVEVMNWLRQQTDFKNLDSIFSAAAKSGSIPMMDYCLQNGLVHSESICSSAMENKNEQTALDALIWLQENNFPWDERVCANAAMYGNLKALKWARENGCPWNSETFNCAAQYGNIEILDYCFENNCPIDQDIYHYPFEINIFDPFDNDIFDPLVLTFSDLQEISLRVYKWLHQHSIPWDENESRIVARQGHLKTLMWAVENGCPWHEDILGYAIDQFDFPFVEYCIQHVSPMDGTVYVLAIDRINSESDAKMITMLQKIHDCGIPWSRDILPCAERLGRSNVASWLRCVGCPE